MNGLPIDPSMALQEANQSDLVRRKLDMDALRQRLGDNTTKQEKLRESCEGFEAIFLQKMWEQMRKTVPKEGYLHSKDEEMYQSLFDIELCKKMASAGGIGLADMLYEQLSQQLENTGRTTSPGSYRMPLRMAPPDTLMAVPAEAPAAQEAAQASANKTMTAEALYTPLPEGEEEAAQDGPRGEALIENALHAIKAELGMAPQDAPGAAVSEWAAGRDAMTGREPPRNPETEDLEGADVPAGADVLKEMASSRKTMEESNPALASWQGPGHVSAKPRPLSPFKRSKKAGKVAKTEAAEAAEAKPASPQRGMAPQDTLWPLSGDQGVVASRFGWEDDPSSGRRRWNPGVRIDADPGTSVRAILPGTVVYAGQREGYGNTVVLEHKEGYRSYYSNLEETTLKVGDQVKHGVEFARISAQPFPATDGENSASLLFELKKGEMALNPEIAIRRLTTASR